MPEIVLRSLININLRIETIIHDPYRLVSIDAQACVHASMHIDTTSIMIESFDNSLQISTLKIISRDQKNEAKGICM